MTRIETFTDAAFAFALTLLVISFDELPSDFAEFSDALRRIPTFAACFAQIAMFWYAHHAWSRRYGLDDLATALLSLALVFVTLIYVFPLRIVFSALFAWITNGWVPYELDSFDPGELGSIFIIYGAGFVAMSVIIVGFYGHAWRQRDALELTSAERFTTASEAQAWSIIASTGVLSILIAALAPPPWQPFAGMAYALLAIVMPIFGVVKSARFRQQIAVDHRKID